MKSLIVPRSGADDPLERQLPSLSLPAAIYLFYKVSIGNKNSFQFTYVLYMFKARS
jgi:hypothetical protein